MMKSKYLARFSKVSQSELPIHGGRFLLEIFLDEEMKSAGGLILTIGRKDELQSPTVGVVLALGAGYEDGSSLTLNVGNIVLLPSHAIRAYSTFPGLKDYAGGDIALAREGDVMASWLDVAAFEAYSLKLNGGV